LNCGSAIKEKEMKGENEKCIKLMNEVQLNTNEREEIRRRI
jgi:hypothetical protein